MKKVIKTTKTVYLCDRCEKDLYKYQNSPICCKLCRKEMCKECFGDRHLVYETSPLSGKLIQYTICNSCSKNKKICKMFEEKAELDMQKSKLYTRYLEESNVFLKKIQKINSQIISYIDNVNQKDAPKNE